MYEAEAPGVEELADSLPTPAGYKLLIATAKISDKIGSILLPDQHKDLQDTASILGLVVSMGPDAYADSKKFPNGPYCRVGDWVMFRSYSGTRFKISDAEFRFVNDDQVEAVAPEPQLVKRV